MEQMQSNELNELFGALAKAQAEIKGAVKDSANPFFKSRYSDLTSVMEACKEALSKNELAVIQSHIVIDGANFLLTTLGHSSGQFIKSICPLIMAKNDAQSFGAATTYMRRFALAAIVGVCPEDDDGEKERIAAEKQAKEPKPTPEQVAELKEILKGCPMNFTSNVSVALSARKWKGIEDMDLVSFNVLLANAISKRDEYQELSDIEAFKK
jgi:predicted aconitase